MNCSFNALEPVAPERRVNEEAGVRGNAGLDTERKERNRRMN